MKIGRNDPCPCGSNKKYKNCCLGKAAKIPVAQKLMLGVIVLVFAVSAVLFIASVRNHESSNQGGAGLVWSEEHQHWHRE